MLTYGEQLKALREQLRLSQEAMAARMGYKRQANLSLYENNKKRPSVKTVLRHARGFNQKPSDFLRDVIVTDYDRVRAGDYDDLAAKMPRPNVPSEEPGIDKIAIAMEREAQKPSRLRTKVARRDDIDPKLQTVIKKPRRR